MNFRISERALADLREIWTYTFFNWSEVQADQYISLIHSEIESLPGNIMKGKSIEEVKEGVRYIKVKSHLIFYKISADKLIEVLRVLHERMNFKERLKESKFKIGSRGGRGKLRVKN